MNFLFIEAPRIFGSLGAGLVIFRELGSTGNYFRGAGEQAYTLGDFKGTLPKSWQLGLKVICSGIG